MKERNAVILLLVVFGSLALALTVPIPYWGYAVTVGCWLQAVVYAVLTRPRI